MVTIAQMIEKGFEPLPPKRLVPKTNALDRSATLPFAFPKYHINGILNSCSAVSTPEVYGLYILFTTCFL